MELSTQEQAQTVIKGAIGRATERYVAQLAKGNDPVRFTAVLGHSLPPMVARVLRSVEESFWRREVDRRKREPRFQYGDPALSDAAVEWDKHLRSTMVLTVKELRQLVDRALNLQVEAITSPVECLKANYFVREERISIRSATIIANHLGLEEQYIRALTFMAQDDESQAITADEFRRIVRDVDAKEFGGIKDLAALAALSQVLLVLGLRSDDEPGEAPPELAEAIVLLRGTSAGLQAVKSTCEGRARVPMPELEGLFVTGKKGAAEPAQSPEEVHRFLEELGVDADDVVAVEEATGGAGGVRFILTEEEKQAYVARAVGRNVHLIDPIMKALEGALTWEEVDRAINDMIPDNVRDEDLSARSYKTRIRER